MEKYTMSLELYIHIKLFFKLLFNIGYNAF